MKRDSCTGLTARRTQSASGISTKRLRKLANLPKSARRRIPIDGEALFALTLAAGMESVAETILQKKRMNGLKRMKEANASAKQLLAQHPDVADAYIATGIANYIVGSQSAGSRF